MPCFGCKQPAGPFAACTSFGVCPGCQKSFCSKCLNFACVTEDDSSKGLAAPVTVFCRNCFQKESSLDFSKPHDVFEGDGSTQKSPIIFLHGGGGCRIMFVHHAQQISKRTGSRCVLVDLPGHGSRMDEKLTTESGIDCIRAAVSGASTEGGRKPVVVGGSLGGYLLMDYVGVYPQSIAAAVVCMCGQRVGVGRTSWMAYFGLLAMDAILPSLSNKTLMEGMVSAVKANSHMDSALVMEGSLRPGMFFGQASAQIEVLRRSDPSTNLPLFNGPVLFVNGSKDHRDHEEAWRSLCPHPLSALKVFPDGDHFFTHDERFREQFLADVVSFVSSVQQA